MTEVVLSLAELGRLCRRGCGMVRRCSGLQQRCRSASRKKAFSGAVLVAVLFPNKRKPKIVRLFFSFFLLRSALVGSGGSEWEGPLFIWSKFGNLTEEEEHSPGLRGWNQARVRSPPPEAALRNYARTGGWVTRSVGFRASVMLLPIQGVQDSVTEVVCVGRLTYPGSTRLSD